MIKISKENIIFLGAGIITGSLITVLYYKFKNKKKTETSKANRQASKNETGLSDEEKKKIIDAFNVVIDNLTNTKEITLDFSSNKQLSEKEKKLNEANELLKKYKIDFSQDDADKMPKDIVDTMKKIMEEKFAKQRKFDENDKEFIELVDKVTAYYEKENKVLKDDDVKKLFKKYIISSLKFIFKFFIAPSSNNQQQQNKQQQNKPETGLHTTRQLPKGAKNLA
jgi:hypothetical protein